MIKKKDISEKNGISYRILISGGRDFADYVLLKTECDRFIAGVPDDRQVIIISGEATGAEKLGSDFAREHGFHCETPLSETNRRRGNTSEKVAGRNADLLQNADAVVAFWDGEDGEIKDLIRQAQEKRIPVQIVPFKAVIANNVMLDRCSLVRSAPDQWCATWKDFRIAVVEQRRQDFIVKEMTARGTPFRALMKPSLESAFREICRYLKFEFKV